MEFLKQYKTQILEEFQKLSNNFPNVLTDIKEQIKNYNSETALALCYLYTTMPISDMINYDLPTFLEYAEHGVYLWKNLKEVQQLPEEIFLNYVLLHRINEEEIRPCRKLFYEHLKSRTNNHIDENAAIEVNYWCAENVTYQCSDVRTLSAISIYNQGHGRCGEESVFTVNALRSVGIPARQVYVPLWSHCDDNHAWVEVWCNGKWQFLGACEPQPVLNRGWFTEASSRAMMVHTRLFGNIIPSNEEIVGKEGCVTIFNELSRYASVKRIEIQVILPNGNFSPETDVHFCVLNEARYGTIAVVKTDDTGKASLLTGEGSLYIQAKFENYDGEMIIDSRSQQKYILHLKNATEDQEWTSLNFFAPIDTPVNCVQLTATQKAESSERLAIANAIRTERFNKSENLQKISFLQKITNNQQDFYRKKLIQLLNEKDLSDFNAKILESHLTYALKYEDQYPQDIFISYILNPRIEYEILSDWRPILEKTYRDYAISFRNNPSYIWDIINSDIVEKPNLERTSVITIPSKLAKYKIASELSKKILYVAIARTFGIPSRLNPIDQAMEYWTQDGFCSVKKSEAKTAILSLSDKNGITWIYSHNWAIEKWTKNGYQPLLLNNLNLNWTEAKLDLKLSPGRYRILTTNRLPNGNQFVQQKTIFLKANERHSETLYLREANLKDILEKIQVPEFFITDKNEKSISSYELTNEGKHVIIWLEEGCEPTEHILNELIEQKENFYKWKEQLIFVVRSDKALADKTLSKFLNKFGNIAIYYDTFTENVNMLGRRMYVDPEQLPLIIVFDAKSIGIYAESGYNVGTGNMLLKILEEIY